MKSLTERDFRCLSEFLRRSYALCDLAQLRSQIVANLPEMFSSDVTVFNEVDALRRQLRHVTNPTNAMNFPDSVKIFEAHMHEHPLIAYHSVERKRGVVKISDFMSPARFRNLGIYQEFFRRVGTEHQMVCVIGTSTSRLIGIAVNRSGKDFNERERSLLALALPHLRQAYNNAAIFTRLSEEAALTKRQGPALDGLVVLDLDGHAELISRQDQILLWKYFGKKSADKGIPYDLLRWVRSQSHCLTRFKVPVSLVLTKGTDQLSVRLFPDPERFLLLLKEYPIGTRNLSIAGPEPLTEREKEVLKWVAQGKSNSSIASILAVSVRTVEKHLEHVYEKLGVENRTAACLLAEV